MVHIYLVRHAHAAWTPDENRPLSPRGIRDCEQITTALYRFPIDTIYASPYRRAAQTVEAFAEQAGLPIRILDDLCERRLADGPVDDFEAVIHTLWANPDFAHPGGESNFTAQVRGVAAIKLLCARHPQGHVVVATHGNLMALILQYFDPSLGYAFWKGLRMPDLYRLVVEKDDMVRIERLIKDSE